MKKNDMNKRNTESRGLRNRNPLNLPRDGRLLRGLAAQQDDPDHYRFKSMAWGYRAAFVTLRRWHAAHGGLTVTSLTGLLKSNISDMEADIYIRKICCLTGLPRDGDLDVTDPDTMLPLAAAISRIENGVPARTAEIADGWALYMG